MSGLLNTPDAVRDWHAGLLAAATVAALTHNGMPARYVATRAEARELILGEIPPGAGVGLGGSMTARELELAAGLLERGCHILNERLSRPDFYELSLEERAQIHRRAIVGDFYVTSVHAITRGGQLVLLNGSGNSIAALSYAAARVYVVAGHNKLVGTLEEALVRARHVAAVMNSRRLGRANPCVVDGICHDESCELPDRLCNKTLIVDREELIGRIQVVLVGEVLGF